MSVVGSNALAGASGQGGAAGAAYEIERSLRFNNDDSAHLDRDVTAAGNQQKMTFSFWVKRNSVDSSDESMIVGGDYLTSPSNAVVDRSLSMHFTSNKLKIYDYGASNGPGNTGSVSEWTPATVGSDRLFRDPSAWYHCVFAIDTTQGTAANRCKVWINGEQETLSNPPPQNAYLSWGQVRKHYIGIQKVNGSFTRAADFQLSEFHFVDGQQLAASDFGEYDSNNNWNPKEYAGSYDQSVGGRTIANSTGAVPILNTSDADGQTVSSGVRSDSNSANIVLALPLNGSNGGTTITDYHHTIKGSGSAKAVSIYTGSASGGAVTSTAASKYYGSSFYAVRGATNNYSASDYIYRTGDSDLAFGTGSFCVEFWYRPGTFVQNSSMFDNRHNSTDWPNATHGFQFFTNHNGDLYLRTGSGYIITASSKLTEGQWAHLAVTGDYSGSSRTIRVFCNGTLAGSATNNNNFSEGRFTLGSAANNGEGSNGYYADLRIYKGVAKYTSNFDVPELGVGGVNSFYLKFADNSSNAALGTDSSGLSNTFTVNNLSAANKTSSTGGSWYFNGSSANCSVDDSSIALGSGDYTVEYFLKPDTGYNAQSTHYNGMNGNSPNFESDGATKFRLMGGNTYGPTMSAGSWYHCAVVRENGACTMWVNGTRYAHNVSHTTNYTNTKHIMGARSDNNVDPTYTKGWLSNIHVIVGTAKYSPSSSTINIPLVPIPTHPNTKLLALHASTMVDGSGQNLSITNNGATASNDLPSGGAAGTPLYSDSLIDSPTNYTPDSGNPVGNYCTMNPLLHVRRATLSEGNLKATGTGSYGENGYGTIAVSSGKWYAEATVTGGGGASNIMLGVKDVHQTGTTDFGAVSRGYAYRNDAKRINSDLVTASYGATYTAGDVIGIALDLDAGTITFYKNGSSQGQAYSGISSSYSYHFCSFCRNASDSVLWNFGQTPFAYTPPSNHLTVCTQNLPEPTIKEGSTAMNATLYTGNGSARNISTPYSPGLVWIKSRSAGYDHGVFDVVRGANQRINSNSDSAEGTEANSVTAFNADSFSLGTLAFYNNPSTTFVAWNWDAGSSTVSNTDGTITSQCRANPSAGISIVSYTGNGTAGATVGHGLSAAPELIIQKNRTDNQHWPVYAKPEGATKTLSLNLTHAALDATSNNYYNSTEPTSSVFSLGNVNHVNSSGKNYIAYCFAPVSGFSAIGKYTSNNSADGPFVMLSFRPKWIMFKNLDAAWGWYIHDTSRSPDNPATEHLIANAGNAESTYSIVDILSNGFKLNAVSEQWNKNSEEILYIAFAEHPFKTARAR